MRWATLDGTAPQVIAHRGSSGLWPEHVLPGYAQALADGADILEPDLVPSRDGVLFCRHDPSLGRSTDIALRPEFADRRRDGDWPVDALDAAEVDRLRAIQPWPGRPAVHDRQHAAPRFSALLDWAGEQASARGQRIVLYPEIKHPTAFAERGRDPVPLFAQALRRCPSAVDVLLQCFEAEPLRRAFAATACPPALLVDADADPRALLAEHGDWLAGLALSKRHLVGRDAPALIETIHRRGLRVDAWTFRDDAVGEGFSRVEDELTAAMRLGVDRLFCDFPATAVAVRARLQAG
jgi:glycerophosphoryl diester phosphodiesterase